MEDARDVIDVIGIDVADVDMIILGDATEDSSVNIADGTTIINDDDDIDR